MITSLTLKEAKEKRDKISVDRSGGTLVKPTKITFDELCQKWLDSKHDVREVTRLGYAQVLKAGQGETRPD
jgi:hypothetical protein